MTDKQKERIKKIGLKESDFEKNDNNADIDAALCELADMLAAHDDAIVELAELIGGAE